MRICVILRHCPTLFECLDSLAQIASHRFSTLILAKRAHTRTIREAYPPFPILETNGDLSLETSYNQGIEWALSKPFKWILLLNHQALIDPLCLTAFLNQANASPHAKIFGAKILRHANPTQIDHLGGLWKPEVAAYSSLTEERQSVDYVSANALFLHRSVPESIGYFEPRYHGVWHDIDYCFRARRKGFGVQVTAQAKVWCSGTTDPVLNTAQDHCRWWRSRLLWLERNLPPEERRSVYKRVIYPEIRHSLARLFSRASNKAELRASLRGVWQYYWGRY